MKKNKKERESRYKTVSYRGIKGIRQDTKSKKFLVEKTVRGERHSASFETLKEAADWKKNFHPWLHWEPIAYSEKKKQGLEKRLSDLGLEIRRPVGMQTNGADLGYTFGDVWELYLVKHVSKLESITFETYTMRTKSFNDCLMKFPWWR